MGRFIREELAREGVDVTGVITDPERLTALVLLGIRDDRAVPADLLPRELRGHGAVRGRYRPRLHRRCPRGGRHRHAPEPSAHRGRRAEGAAIAREGGARTALDIDYRPNLWGLAGHGAGESALHRLAAVTAKLQSTCRCST
jgi:5-dehydro-2-deoxygluconokinase